MNSVLRFEPGEAELVLASRILERFFDHAAAKRLRHLLGRVVGLGPHRGEVDAADANVHYAGRIRGSSRAYTMSTSALMIVMKKAP